MIFHDHPEQREQVNIVNNARRYIRNLETLRHLMESENEEDS